MKKITASLFLSIFTLLFFYSDDVRGEISEKNYDKLPQHVIEFRKEFGFTADLNEVLEISSNYKNINNEFGVPLSPDEIENLKGRQDIQDRILPNVQATLMTNLKKEDYSIYIDQKDNGKIVVKLKDFNNNIDKVKNNIEKKITKSNLNDIKFENANYTEDELDIIAEIILKDAKSHKVKIDSVSVDTINEKLIIGLINYQQENALELLEFYKEYPIEVIKVDEPGDHRTAYGGERLDKSRGGSCSAGYYAKKGTSYFLITAGHCSRTWDGQEATYHYSDVYDYNGDKLGSVNNIGYGGSIDALTISVSSSKANRTVNINGGLRNMTSYEQRDADVVGQTVCMVGQYNSTCSTLKSKNVSYSRDGSWFSRLRGSSYSTQGGDSGGTVYSSFKYLGINKGSGGGYSGNYTQIGEINTLWGLTGY